MSDPTKCMALGPSAENRAGETPPRRGDGERPTRRHPLSLEAQRLIEDWIVGVVTVISAAVILATVLTHRDPPAASVPTATIAVEPAHP